MNVAADAVLMAAIIFQAGLVGANALEGAVNVVNWRDPDGIVAYRNFARYRHNGQFYQVVAPLTVALLVAAVVLSWLAGGRFLLVAAALASVVVAEVFTVGYFLPRVRKLFHAPIEAKPTSTSLRLVNQWATANLIRIALLVAGAVASLLALARH